MAGLEHNWEVLKSESDPAGRGQAQLRRLKVPGGWLYESAWADGKTGHIAVGLAFVQTDHSALDELVKAVDHLATVQR